MYSYGDKRVPARIWAKTVVTDDGCWIWTGATGGSTHKYGVALLDGKTRGVHRWIYGVFVRPARPDEHVHHEKCGVTLCINPAHLRALPIPEHIGEWHRVKTHCPHGHPYSLENTHIRPSDNARQCRTCARLRARRKRESVR